MRIGPFGIWEILIILVVVLLVFGPRRLPEMAKGLGQSVRAFRKELRDMKSELDLDGKSDAPPPAPAPVAAPPPPVAAPQDAATAPAPERPKAQAPREGGDAST
jgi:sec-independent protein translocase protein TatA